MNKVVSTTYTTVSACGPTISFKPVRLSHTEAAKLIVTNLTHNAIIEYK